MFLRSGIFFCRRKINEDFASIGARKGLTAKKTGEAGSVVQAIKQGLRTVSTESPHSQSVKYEAIRFEWHGIVPRYQALSLIDL